MIARHVTMSQSGRMMMGNGFLVGALPTEAKSAEYKIVSPRKDPLKNRKSFQSTTKKNKKW